MIKTLLAPYELYIWAAIVVLLLLGGVYEVHHLENIGVQRQQAADAKLAAAQQVHTEEVEARAQQLAAAAGGQLHTALVAPDPILPVAVRVCPRATPTQSVVPANGSASPGSVGNPAALLRSVADGSTDLGVDIAPTTEALLRRADAEITYWRQYYATCKAEGACK